MAEYDRLPGPLRRWLAAARLPWRPGSVLRAYRRALAHTRDPDRALAALDRIEARLIARDAARIWGAGHPAAGQAEPETAPAAHQPRSGAIRRLPSRYRVALRPARSAG